MLPRQRDWIEEILQVNEEQDHKEQSQTNEMDGVLILWRNTTTEEDLWQREHNATTIQCWNRQQVEDAE